MTSKMYLPLTFCLLTLSSNAWSLSASDIEKELRFLDSMKEAQEQEFRYLQQRNKQLRKERFEIMGVTSDVARLPANEQNKNKLGTELAQHLERELKKGTSKIHIDPANGSVNLSMRDFSLFANNASELDQEAKSRLATLMPAYFSALSNFKYFENIKSINIVGHASPVFQQQFVDPKGISKREQEAYLFNLDISAFRAREIVKFIFDERFNSVKNIGHFRSRLQSVGKSFNHPIKRAPSSVETLCGPFDCDLSRRVELAVEFQ